MAALVQAAHHVGKKRTQREATRGRASMTSCWINFPQIKHGARIRKTALNQAMSAASAAATATAIAAATEKYYCHHHHHHRPPPPPPRLPYHGNSRGTLLRGVGAL